MNRPKNAGFALVEMVIVILAIGIVAVVAAPRLFNAESRAERDQTRQQLTVLRSAIELYQAQSGVYPPIHQLPHVMASMLNGPFPSPTIGSVRGDGQVYYDLDSDVDMPVVADASQPGGWAYKPVNGTLKLNVEPSEVGAEW
jgi:prepilin-type N-terminal cleavage/methylation domain-containing protein